MSYLTNYGSDAKIPQTEPLNSRQKENNAGGFTYVLDDFERLARFLIIGTQGGSYYVGEKHLTEENVKLVNSCLDADPARTMNLAAAISSGGRAPKNDQAIFVLACALGHDKEEVRKLATEKFATICRIPTHVFMLASMIKSQGKRGWGRALRRMFASYYTGTKTDKLLTAILKYRNREGWTHGDLIRKSHPNAGKDKTRSAILNFAVRGENKLPKGKLKSTLNAFAELNDSENPPTVDRAKKIIEKFGFQREMVPTGLQSDKVIQAVTWGNMGYTALMRNLAGFTKSGLIDEQSEAGVEIAKALVDAEKIKKSMVHPLNVLLGAKTYASGRSLRGDSMWGPVGKINRALDQAFELAFGNVNVGNKQILVALDVSGSMGANISGFPISSREVAAGMALPLWKSNPDNVVVLGFETHATRLPIENHPTMQSFCDYIAHRPFGGTDCAQPFIWAKDKKLDFDGVLVITDNETYQGKTHVDVAKKAYEKQVGHPVKMVVIGTVASKFTIGDPEDANVLNIAGFDGAIASLVTDFLLGGKSSSSEDSNDE